jgi:hypothetical protein
MTLSDPTTPNPAEAPETGFALAKLSWTLERDPFGKLVLTNNDGERFGGVVPVRAFPVQSPQDGIALVNTDGKEVAWIPHLAALPKDYRSLIDEELAGREFMPVIHHISSVTSFSTPCTWTVATDRGDTQFVLRGDEDIRRIGTDGALLVADIHGIQYLIRNQFALDATSKKILDRFL